MKSVLLQLLLLLTLVSSGIRAQSLQSDSLQDMIDRPALPEEKKPALLNQLAEIHRLNKDYKKAMAMAIQSARIARKHHQYTEAAKAYTLQVNIKYNAQELPSMKQSCDTALSMAQQAKDPVAMAYAWYAQVLLYKTLDEAEKMVKYCHQGLKELEKKDDPYIAAKIYYQLYAVHADWNNAAKMKEYAAKATENALKTTDYNVLSNCYAAMSMVHEYEYNASGKITELDSTLYYLSKSDKLFQQHPGQVANHTYAITCINIANCYLKYFPPTDEIAKTQAIHYANTARTILTGVGNSQEVIANSLGILNEYARREGNTTQAESYLLEAYRIMKTSRDPYGYTMTNVVQSLADFYAAKGDYQKALGFQKEVTTLNSKNFNQQQARNTQKLEIQFETEKKNNEMRVLKEREKGRRQQNYLYGCIALASVLGLLFMFRSYHFRIRYAKEREKQLELEKQDSELQIKLEKEEQARLRVEQQLLETQQQQLKKEVMANVLQLEHKNKMLHNIKDKLTDGDSVNMRKIIKEEMVLDNDFEHAKLQIQQVHPDFFQLLNEKAQKKLTLLDLKLCTYLYLKMDTRQIARMMHIEPKSVRMSRYRIKQKLGLQKEDDLQGFLQGLVS